MMAEAASNEAHEGEAEAMAGASFVTVISPKDRRALRRILPHLTRGTAILTRILRRRRSTRVGVRAVPTIMRRTVKSLKRQAAKGMKITRRRAGRTAATQVRRVLGNLEGLRYGDPAQSEDQPRLQASAALAPSFLGAAPPTQRFTVVVSVP